MEDNAQRVGLALKEQLNHWFGEDAGDVVGGGTEDQENGPINNLFKCVMIVYLYMLCLRMKHRVAGAGITALIVVVDGG